MSRSTYVIYGVRVQDDAQWFELEEDPGQCDNSGTVGYFTAGKYDENMAFLAVEWSELHTGQYKLHVPYERDMRVAERDERLLETADRLGLRVLDGPGWYCIADES